MAGQPNTLEPRWQYDLTDANEDKSTKRTGLPAGRTSELIGVDGRSKGAVRPHFGYRHIRDLSGNLGSSMFPDQEVRDLFWVTFRIGEDKEGLGAVYRVREVGGDTCKYFIEWRDTASATWYGPTSLIASGTRLSAGQKQMDVVVYGQFVYVYVEGEEPFMLYRDETQSAGVITVFADTGTNATPIFGMRDYTGVAGYVQSHVGASQDMIGGGGENNFLDIADFDDPPVDIDSRGRLIVWQFSPSGYAGTILQLDTGSGGAVVGPSASTLFTGTPPQPDPFLVETTVGSTKYVSVSPYLDSTGATSTDVPAFLKGLMNFSYRLFDSRTGRWGSFAPVVQTVLGVATGGFNADIDFAKVFYTQGQARRGGFPALDLIYDTRRFDTLYLYRSLEGESQLRLEAAYTLSTYHVKTAQQPADTNYKRAHIWYRLGDGSLQVKDVVSTSTLYDEEMPTGGSAIYYEGSMFVGKLGVLDTGIGGLGVIRWSDTELQAVESYKPLDKYVMQQAGEEVERFLNMGKHLLGFTRVSQYIIHKFVSNVKCERISEGFGVVGARACCEVGTSVYYLTGEGFSTIQQDGSINDLSALDALVTEEWTDLGLEDVRMAYDPTVKCVVAHNPASGRGHTVFMWLRTGSISEGYDVDWACVIEGQVPSDMADDEPLLQKRAVFLQNVNVTGIYSGWRWRVCVLDHLREKVDPDSNTRYSTMDFTGPSRFTLADDVIGVPADSTIDLGETLGSRIEGCMLYQMSGPGAGKWCRIARVAAGGEGVVLDSGITQFLTGSKQGGGTGLDAGIRLCISPMYTRWGGSLPGSVDDQGQPFGGNDYFRVRGISEMRVAFTDVQGEAAVDEEGDMDARWWGLVYRGNGDEPVARAVASATNGTKAVSVVEINNVLTPRMGAGDDGYVEAGTGAVVHQPVAGVEGAAVFPGFEVFVTDLDFQALSVRVAGVLKGSEMEAFPETQ